MLGLCAPAAEVTSCNFISQNNEDDVNPNEKGIQVDVDELLGLSNAAVQVDTNELNIKKHCEIQVDTADLVTVSDFVKTEKQLTSVTGINSFLLFNSLVSLIGTFYVDKRVHRLSMFNRVFLAFMKLKLDMPYCVLSILFGVSANTCKKNFVETVVNLSTILRNVIEFPSAVEIKSNLPKCFKDFSDVRVVLDCTEIPLQRHKRLCCRVKCYSHYKRYCYNKIFDRSDPRWYNFICEQTLWWSRF